LVEIDPPASSQVAFLHLCTIRVDYLPRAEKVELKGEKVRWDIGDDLVVREIYLVQLTTIWAATLFPEDHKTPIRACCLGEIVLKVEKGVAEPRPNKETIIA
jgi:hypothetical protein